MFFTKIACSLATLATAVTAADFYLKTTGSTNPSFNNLYVESYHTGAGLSDAVLSSNISTAAKFFQNETNIQADFGPDETFGIYLDAAINYAGWEFVTINSGYGNPNFTITNGQVAWEGDEEFAGWLACNWWHDAPQLFWAVKYYSPSGYPSSCSKVTLTTAAV